MNRNGECPPQSLIQWIKLEQLKVAKNMQMLFITFPDFFKLNIDLFWVFFLLAMRCLLLHNLLSYRKESMN